MRRHRVLILIPAVAIALAALAVPRLFHSSDGRTLPEARAGVAKTCPRLVPHDLPPGMTPVESQTRNLGAGVFGRSTTYSDGYREASFHVGYDIIFALDDLDFLDSTARIGGRTVTIHVPRAFPQGAMYAASWRTSIGPPRCSLLTVLTKRFSRAEFDRIVASVELEPAS